MQCAWAGIEPTARGINPGPDGPRTALVPPSAYVTVSPVCHGFSLPSREGSITVGSRSPKLYPTAVHRRYHLARNLKTGL